MGSISSPESAHSNLPLSAINCYQGMSGFEKQINHLMDLTRYQVEKLKSEPEKFYLIVSEPECTNVCFWYIPTRLRSEKRDHWWQDELGRSTATLKVSGPGLSFMIYPIWSERRTQPTSHFIPNLSPVSCIHWTLNVILMIYLRKTFWQDYDKCWLKISQGSKFEYLTFKMLNSGPYDEGGQHDDQLPATRGTSKLLPLHHLQPGPDRGRRGLHAGGARQAWSRLVRWPVSTIINIALYFLNIPAMDRWKLGVILCWYF